MNSKYIQEKNWWCWTHQCILESVRIRSYLSSTIQAFTKLHKLNINFIQLCQRTSIPEQHAWSGDRHANHHKNHNNNFKCQVHSHTERERERERGGGKRWVLRNYVLKDSICTLEFMIRGIEFNSSMSYSSSSSFYPPHLRHYESLKLASMQLAKYNNILDEPSDLSFNCLYDKSLWYLER